MKHIGKYRVEDFPVSRLATIDIGVASKMKHHIKALIELDVTEARKMIAEKKKQKQPLIGSNVYLHERQKVSQNHRRRMLYLNLHFWTAVREPKQ